MTMILTCWESLSHKTIFGRLCMTRWYVEWSCPSTRDEVYSQELVLGRIGSMASNLVAILHSRLLVGG